MDFRPKLYKFTLSLLVSIFVAHLYAKWHERFGLSNYLGPFVLALVIMMVVVYVILSLLEERW